MIFSLLTRNFTRRGKRRISNHFGREFVGLEDRSTPYTVGVNSGTLTLTYQFSNETIVLANTGTSIAGSDTTSPAEDGFFFPIANVNRIVVSDSSANSGQTLTFTNAGGFGFTLTNGLSVSGIDTVTFDQFVNASGGSGSIDVNVTKNIAVNAAVTTGNGNLTFSANRQSTASTGTFIGVAVTGATVQSTGSGQVSISGRSGDGTGFRGGVEVGAGGVISGGTSGTLTVDGIGGAGSISDSYGVYVHDANSMITSLGAAIQVTGQGGGAASTFANAGVGLAMGGVVRSGGTAAVTVNGTGGATTGERNYGVYVADPNSTITSNGGNVTVSGKGQGDGNECLGVVVFRDGNITAGGTGSVTVTGTGSTASTGKRNFGVWVVGVAGTNSAKITSSGGAVNVTGTGGGVVSSAASTNNVGVFIEVGSVVSAGTNANLTINGTGGTGGGGFGNSTNAGVEVNASTVQTTGTGVLTVTGKGGSKDREGYGVAVRADGLISGGSGSTGTIIDGTGGSGNLGLNHGVYVVGTNSKITSTGGKVQVTGVGGAGSGSANNYGVNVQQGTITAGGTGGVFVTGTGGGGLNGYNLGVSVTGTITSGGGDVSVTGTGGTLSVIIAGIGFGNMGVDVSSPGLITAGGTGNVAVSGTGSTSALSQLNHGVSLTSGTGVNNITSNGGNITITGVAGGKGADSDSNNGIILSGGIAAGGNGSVTLVGTGGQGTGTKQGNYGVTMSSTFGGKVTSNNGAISITGTHGENTALDVFLDFGATNASKVASGGSSPVTIVADSFALSASASIRAGTAGDATFALRPRTAGTNVDLGGADATGTLGLSSAELGSISAGTYEIGSTTAGALAVTTTAVSLPGDSLKLLSGVSIDIDQTLTAATVGLKSGGPIHIDADVTGNLHASASGVIDQTNSTIFATTVSVQNTGTFTTSLAVTGSTVALAGSSPGGPITFNVTGGIAVTGAIAGLAGITSTQAGIVSGGSIYLLASGDIAVSGATTTIDAGNTFVSLNTFPGGHLAITGDALVSGKNFVSISADRLTIAGTSTKINAGPGAVVIVPALANRSVNLGGDDSTAGAGFLGLTDAELDRVSAATLILGSLTGGPVSLTAAIGPANATTTEIRSAADITSTGGSFLTNTGGLNLSAGATKTISLTGGNGFTNGPVRILQANTVTLANSGGSFRLGTSTVAGNLTVTAAADLADEGAIQVGGLTKITAAGAVTLDDAGNNFNTLAVSTGASNGAITLRDGSGVTLGAGGLNAGSGGVTLLAGSVFLTAANGIAGNVNVNSGATLTGAGTVNGDVSGAGAFAAGPTVGTITINGNFAPTGFVGFQVNPTGSVAGTDHDQFVVNGTLDLGGATILFAGTASPPAVPLNRLVTLIDNNITDGTIPGSNPAQGTELNIGGNLYRLYYNGGSGNDVVLVSTGGQLQPTIYLDDSFTQNEGQLIADADAGTAGSQPAIFGVNAFTTLATALANLTPSGTLVVNAGNYTEAVVLTGTRTLQVVGAASFNSLDGSASTSILLDGASSLTVGDAASTAYAGVISGAGGLVKRGAGTLVLTGSNSYGATTISGGSLQIGDGGLTGTLGTGAVGIGTQLAIHRNGAVVVPNVLSGAGSLIQMGAGTTVLTGANSYGSTHILAGTLQIGNAGTTGSLGAGGVTNAGTIIFNRSNALAVSNGIAGTGTIVQSGGGTTTLGGTNSASTLTVTGGRLDVTGPLTANVVATAPGTLGGGGTITGNVSGNGTFAPGASPGLLTINGNFTPTGTLAFEVNGAAVTPGVDTDQFAVNGKVDLSVANLTFVGTAAGLSPNQQVVLIANDGSDSIVPPGTPTDGSIVTVNGTPFRLFFARGTGNDLVLDSDFTGPTVFGLTPNRTTLNVAASGASALVLTVVFDSTMDTGTNPTVSFPVENPSSVLSFNTGASGWSNANTYVAAFDLAGALTLPDVDVRVTGAKDLVGNLQKQADFADLVDIDTVAPAVSAVNPSASTIAVATVGTNFSLTVSYTEAMNTGVNPAVSFPAESPAGTLTFNAGTSGWTNATTYVAKYSVANANAALADVDVRVTGGLDLAGNPQPTFTAPDLFDIDTQNPTAKITSGPPTFTNSGSASFEFESNDGTTEFELDGGGFSPASGKATVQNLADGPHVVRVRATDASGNSTVATYNWTVDRTAPQIAVGSPAISLSKFVFTVTFTDANPGPIVFSTANVTANTTGSVTVGSVSVSSMIGNTATVTLTDVTGDGTVGLTLAAGIATDQAGNASALTTSTPIGVTTNDAPAAATDSLADSPANAVRTIPFSALLANDNAGSGESGQSLTVVSVGNAVGGTVAIQGTNVVFTPTAGQTGPVSFTYTIQDNGTTNGTSDPKTATATAGFSLTPPPPPPANTPPDAKDDTVTADFQTTKTFFALGNDSDADGNAITIVSVADPAHGTAIPVGQQIAYTPDTGFSGSDSFTYTISDGKGGTDTATVTVTVRPAVATSPLLVGFRDFTVGADAGAANLALFDAEAALRLTYPPFPGFTGGVRTAAADFDGDGVADIVSGTGPGRATQVLVQTGAGAGLLFQVDPFEASFTGGVYVAAGDVDGDGVPDVIVTPDEGGGPRVDIYSGGKNFARIASFFGIDDVNFRGGARAAVADMTGDGTGDLIVVAGFGGGPRVAAFDGTTLSQTPQKIFGDFFAFEQTLRNGIFVTAGDLNGDGFADLIAGGGPGGGPRVLAFDGKSLLSNQYVNLANFFGGDPNSRGGIRMAVKDLDGDSRADLVVGSGSGAGSRVTAYLGKNIAASGTPPEAFAFDAFAEIGNFTGGVFVG